ncbi:hypothetical protein H0A65_17490, partial [Alcaligenaceae bacterium]|nr:hypothetical protein [Alcaligenaceae bacterium]
MRIGKATNPLKDDATMDTILPERTSDADWREASAGELTSYIVTRFHERHRVQLPELIRLAR